MSKEPNDDQAMLMQYIGAFGGAFSVGTYMGHDHGIPKRVADPLERNGWAVIEMRPGPNGKDVRMAKLTEAGVIAAGFERCDEGWEFVRSGAGLRKRQRFFVSHESLA